MIRFISFLILFVFCWGLAAPTIASANQLYKAPLPTFVKRCKQDKAGCFLYSQEQHKALLALLSLGDEAMDKVKTYKRLEAIQKAFREQDKRARELAKKERGIWERERGLLKETIKESKARELLLRKDLLLTRKRNETLERRIRSESLLKQPAVWVGAALVLVVGIGVGYIGANVVSAAK